MSTTLIGPTTTSGKNEEIDLAVSKLDDAIQQLYEEDAFRNYLTYKGRMHNYSWLNTLLILADYYERGLTGPVLTMGWKGWEKQGRKVKKGARAIALFKPVKQYWRSYKNENGDPYTGYDKPGVKFDPDKKAWYKEHSKLLGFEIIRKTFHIQDTDGPEYKKPEPIELEGNDELADKIIFELIAAASDLGVPSTRIRTDWPFSGARGMYHPLDGTIEVDGNMPKAQIAKTLAHEIGHYVAYKLELDHHEVYRDTRGLAESCVEGAAFVVMASYGLDTTGYSVPYITQWSNEPQIIRRLLRDIGNVSKAIIEKLPQGR